jgi:hypothetical protein
VGLSTKNDEDHRTILKLHYDDNRGGEEGYTSFAQSDFVPWCHLFADGEFPVGTLDWEDRLKIIVKIVMLKAEYSEATVAWISPEMLMSIWNNVEKGFYNLPQAPGTDIESSAGQTAASVAPPSVLNHGEEAKDSVKPPHMSRPKSHKGPASHYIKVLRHTIPYEHSFQTSPTAAYEERMISLLDPDSKEYFAFFPGKAFIGHLRGDDNTTIWAAFRRLKPSAKVQTLSGAWRMCFFDDNFFEVELPERLDGTMNFAAAF